MSFQVGDKVSFLNEDLDGVVSKIIDSKKVVVTTNDGFGIPVLIKELVRKGSSSKGVSKEKTSISDDMLNTLNLPRRLNLEEKSYLCFAKNPTNNNELYVLNNTANSRFFVLRIYKSGEWVLLFSGKVNKRSYVFVSSYLNEELNDFGKVIIDTLNVDFSVKRHFAPETAEIKIKTAKFFKESSYSEIPILEKKAMLIDATAEPLKVFDPKKELSKSTESTPKKKTLKSLKIVGHIELKPDKRNRSRGELDLHIEKLGVEFKGKSNGQILEIQLDAAKEFIDKSMQAGKRELVLVHGVGNGTLKKEVHKLLKSFYGIRFEPGDSRKYGKGATLVHLKG